MNELLILYYRIIFNIYFICSTQSRYRAGASAGSRVGVEIRFRLKLVLGLGFLFSIMWLQFLSLTEASHDALCHLPLTCNPSVPTIPLPEYWYSHLSFMVLIPGRFGLSGQMNRWLSAGFRTFLLLSKEKYSYWHSPCWVLTWLHWEYTISQSVLFGFSAGRLWLPAQLIEAGMWRGFFIVAIESRC